MFPPPKKKTEKDSAKMFQGTASFIHGLLITDQSWPVFRQEPQFQTYHFISYRVSMFLVFVKFITCAITET